MANRVGRTRDSPSRCKVTAPSSSAARSRAADPGLDPLCHGEHDHPAVGLGQQPLLCDRPSGLQRRRQVEAAQQPIIPGYGLAADALGISGGSASCSSVRK